MIYDVNNLEFADCLCKSTNKIFSNIFTNEYLTQYIKRIIAFKDNYEKSTHKEFYVLYDVHGTSQPYCVEYRQNNELVQHNTFADLKLAIECYNNYDLESL